MLDVLGRQVQVLRAFSKIDKRVNLYVYTSTVAAQILDFGVNCGPFFEKQKEPFFFHIFLSPNRSKNLRKKIPSGPCGYFILYMCIRPLLTPAGLFSFERTKEKKKKKKKKASVIISGTVVE